jgi:hypothetical protein
MEKAYVDTVRLLLETAPHIFRAPQFALKGVTAWNILDIRFASGSPISVENSLSQGNHKVIWRTLIQPCDRSAELDEGFCWRDIGNSAKKVQAGSSRKAKPPNGFFVHQDFDGGQFRLAGNANRVADARCEELDGIAHSVVGEIHPAWQGCEEC